MENKKWTDTDLRTAFEDGCKFLHLKDLQDFLLKRNKLYKEVKEAEKEIEEGKLLTIDEVFDSKMATIEDLLELLALHGGKIVSTASLKPNEINQARASERIYVDSNSLGFVWMPKIDFPETVEDVKQFEKWFPLEEELPDELKTLDWFYMDETIEKAKKYAIDCHNKTSHQYNGKPYDIHLQMVFDTAKKFIHLIPAEQQRNVLAACWVHDVIEDCRQTYNDVKNATNVEVAELAYALTNEKGKNRKERANDKYYDDIKQTPFATFIKVCDRIANYEYSRIQKSRMAALYEKEMNDFIAKLYNAKYDELFNYLTDAVAKV